MAIIVYVNVVEIKRGDLVILTEGHFTCKKCGKSMGESQFYTYKDGTKTEMCKKCLTMHINNFDEDTFLWLLQKMDVPYIPAEWKTLRDRAYAKDPHKMNGMSVFGKYLSKMKLRQWKDYGWEDTEKLKTKQEFRTRQELEEIKRFEEEVKEKYKKGEISEAEYKTLISTETQNKDTENFEYGDEIQQNFIGNDNPYNENNFMKEDEIPDVSEELTNEDKVYLAMKWGRLYKPHEWIELEKKYTEMTNSFDVRDSDTIGTLILICKTYLKLNQAIDCGDIAGYQQLSRVYDTLRRSAKFTAAQNKQEKGDFVDSVGALVSYCEKEGGRIPKYEIKADLDIVDKVIRDMKDYTKSLIYEDTALSQQIEDYIKKKEISESMKRDKEEAKKQGLDNVFIEDEDITEHYEKIEEERKKDMKTIYGGDDN